jgi:hypothetical protein
MAVHCKFRNSTTSQKLIGCFGEQEEANMRETLTPGAIADDDLIEGQRVLVVWDPFSDLILFHGPFKVDTSANGGKNRFDIVASGGGVTISATYNQDNSSY